MTSVRWLARLETNITHILMEAVPMVVAALEIVVDVMFIYLRL